MRALIQRVSRAAVEVEGAAVGSIDQGLVVFLGVATADQEADADYLSAKILALRIFPDAGGKMNLSIVEAGGCLLVVSQFTLYGDCRKGRRPSFDLAASPEHARGLYNYFVERARQAIHVETGVFQTKMTVSLVNEGPVTFLLESEAR